MRKLESLCLQEASVKGGGAVLIASIMKKGTPYPLFTSRHVVFIASSLRWRGVLGSLPQRRQSMAAEDDPWRH